MRTPGGLGRHACRCLALLKMMRIRVCCAGGISTDKFKYSYFQLTFGKDETYHYPERSYARLKKYGYDAIEVTPPKGRYGAGISMEKAAAEHKTLREEYGLAISCINECWGEKWDPFSPHYKTLTDTKSAKQAVSQTKSSVDFAQETGAPCVTIAAAIHAGIDGASVADCTATTVDALRQMSRYAAQKDIRLVFEANNHLEMGKYINTVRNHKKLIDLTGCGNIGIQIDWFHANIEELNPYEAVMDACPLLWHTHFRDSNSLTPGFGTVDFKSVMRAMKRAGYTGYCTLESAPMFPTAEVSCAMGIEYLKLMESIAEYQLEDAYPNGYPIHL
jgi:sugar phosphate isomerase/epimerase